MKFIKIILAMLVMALSFSSCLESDLKDLPTFDGNDITAGYAWYRYIGEDKINASGQPQVIQKQLQKTGRLHQSSKSSIFSTSKRPSLS